MEERNYAFLYQKVMFENVLHKVLGSKAGGSADDGNTLN